MCFFFLIIDGYIINWNKVIDYVFEKIAQTLPQDILVNLKIKGPKQSNNLKKILYFYKMGEHSNFCKFLEKTKSQKNIVYTFTGYLEDFIKRNDIIKNSLVGEIKMENIKIIQINSTKSEKEFEIDIDKFLKEENLKVCIIKFLPYEGSYMNYVKYFIESKINNNKNYEKKIFIFMMYMTRILIKEKNEIDNKTLKEKEEFNKKILTETLSNLSGFHQIFIDNLNGDSKLKLYEILTMKNSDLIKTIINPDEKITSNIYKIISYMKYNIISSYKNLSKQNYVDTLISFISENKRLRDLMNENIIKKSFKDDMDIIKKIFINKDLFNGKEIEILQVIKDYLSKLYVSQLSLMFFKAEKEQFFSTLLTNNIERQIWNNKGVNEIQENKTIIEKLVESYLENLIYNDGKTNIVKQIGTNEVNIIFGFKIPGIKIIFDKIFVSTKENILKEYIDNENELRNYLDEEEIEEVKEKYFKKLSSLNNSMYNIIYNQEKLKIIINIFKNDEEQEKEIYKLIENDYYFYFLNKNLNKLKDKKGKEEEAQKDQNNFPYLIDLFDNNIRYFDLMFKIRNDIINPNLKEENIPNNNIYKLAKIINWLESYSEEISSLEQIFLKLSLKIPELIETIENNISSGQIKYEISERNPEYTSIVNKVFFLCLDSLLRILTS